MIVPDRERCPLAGRHFKEEIAEGSFGAGKLKGLITVSTLSEGLLLEGPVSFPVFLR